MNVPDAPYYVLALLPSGYHVSPAESKLAANVIHRSAIIDENARHAVITKRKPSVDGDRIYFKEANPPPLPRINEETVSELGLPRPVRKGSRS